MYGITVMQRNNKITRNKYKEKQAANDPHRERALEKNQNQKIINLSFKFSKYVKEDKRICIQYS